MARGPWRKGRLNDPFKQKLINAMTNYWRSQWARAGYPDSIDALKSYAYPAAYALAKARGEDLWVSP